MALSARRARAQTNVWPVYVDVLSSLLILVIFVLLLFTFAQFLMSSLLSSKETELDDLHKRLGEISEMLGLERRKGAELAQDLERLSDHITSLTEDKFELTGRVDDLTRQAEADRGELGQKALLLASLQEDIEALRRVRAELEARVGDLAAARTQGERDLGAERDRTKALEARLAEAGEHTVLAQRDLEQREVRIQALTALLGERDQALDQQRRLSADAQAEVALLNRQIDALRGQLQSIAQALQGAEQVKAEQQVQIEDLGRRLNVALAREVNRLEKYRSEFFGRVRELLGDNPAVRVAGDRFLFESELLFESGSATLGEPGARELAKLAGTLKDIAARIPEDIDWVLQVEGHTDRVPIRTAEFPSNWELSTARAISVVRFLIAQGIPPRRLSAAGFAELHPIEPGDSQEARRKNRRIEIRLTSG